MNIRDIIQKLTDALGMVDASEEQPKMMPPQTQELELAKKMAGVPSEFDTQEESEIEVSDCGCGQTDDQDAEVEYMRKLAGITQNKE